MKKILLFATIFIFSVTASAMERQVERWKIFWDSISANTQNAFPSVYNNISRGKQNARGIKIPDGADTAVITCFTIGDNATNTDFQFMYDNQKANGFELCTGIGANSSCGGIIYAVGEYIKLSADNNDDTDAVKPYCEVTFR